MPILAPYFTKSIIAKLSPLTDELLTNLVNSVAWLASSLTKPGVTITLYLNKSLLPNKLIEFV